MTSIVVRIDPQLLKNPDADIRYVLPDLLAERSKGIITSDGYDYVEEPPFLVLFLLVADLPLALACIVDVLQHIRVLDNHLEKAAMVAIERENEYEVVYPQNFTGLFAEV